MARAPGHHRLHTVAGVSAGVEFFNEKLCALCMTWLGDNVYSIREAAVKNLSELTKVFGVEWSAENIVPKVMLLYGHSNYLFRLTALASVQALSTVHSKEVLQTQMLPLVIQACQDPVPNIRFNVAKTLKELSKRVDREDIDGHIKPALTGLANDKDIDVCYFAKDALAVC